MAKELTNAEKAALAQEMTDSIGASDVADLHAVLGEVKGPDPKVWGHDKDRPANEASIASAEYLDDDGKPMEVKGPDPEVWG